MAAKYNLVTSYHWIKGHQDNTTPIKELLILAQMNIEVDHKRNHCNQ